MNLNHKDISLAVNDINSFLPALVNKIKKGYNNEIIFELYKKDNKKNLIISLNPGLVSLHMSYHPIIYRSEADKIILKLRKIFERKIIERIVQYQNERIVNIFFLNISYYLKFIIFTKTPSLGVYENDKLIFSTANMEHNFNTDNSSIEVKQNYFSSYEISSDYYKKISYLILKEYKQEKIKKINFYLNNYRKTYDKIKSEILNVKDYYKNWADILASYYPNDNRKGLSELKTFDFYGNEIIIKLNPSYSVKDHITIFYNKAKKIAKSINFNQNRIEKLKEKINKLEDEKRIIESYELKDIIKEIKKTESKDGILIKKISNSRRFITYKDNEGNIYIIGRNEDENHHILRIGKKDYLWFHARDYPGSHLLLINNSKKIDNNMISIAGKLAIFYSKCRKFNEGYVIYTRCKYLRRSKGMKKGEVNVLKYKSLFFRIDGFADFIETNLTKI